MEICNRSTVTRLARAATLIVGVAVFCASSPQQHAVAGEPATSSTAEVSTDHATQTVRLRMLMLALEQLTLETLPEQLDQEPPRQKYLADIQSTADALARAADGIPDAIDDLELTDDQAQTFRQLVGRLRSEAIDLRNRAAVGDVGSAGAELDPLLACCNDCHRTFDIDPMGRRGSEE